MMTMFKGSNGEELGWQLVLFLGVNSQQQQHHRHIYLIQAKNRSQRTIDDLI